jgi:hypothetical protein
MADANTKPWRVLALRANHHLGIARLLVGIALDGEPAEAAAKQLHCIEEELSAAQSCVQSIMAAADL